jgi:CubicO group peptidase (beta-lactamase class C family)
MEVYSPEDVGMSSERLARVEVIMEQFVKDNQFPGIMTLAQRKGKVVHLGKYGMMDIEAGKPMREDTLFRLYSMTKPIISVAVMLLFEEGRLTLNDLVSRYIPAFAKIKVDTGSGLVEPDPVITLYHLITHTSGLGYYTEPFEQRTTSLAEAVNHVVQHPLLFQPGTQFSYSSGTDVLGYIIQLIADMPLADFLEERIFKPLGMTDTSFHVPIQKLERLVQMYEFETPGELRIHPGTGFLIGDITLPTNCPSGGAGLVSTLGDYLAFCNCLINNGRYESGRLLSRKTLAWMTSNQTPDHLMPAVINPHTYIFGFGMGFWVDTTLDKARWMTSPGQYGWGGAAHTLFFIDPVEEFIGLLMTQVVSEHGQRLTELYRNLYYQAIVD